MVSCENLSRESRHSVWGFGLGMEDFRLSGFKRLGLRVGFTAVGLQDEKLRCRGSGYRIKGCRA